MLNSDKKKISQLRFIYNIYKGVLVNVCVLQNKTVV